MKCQTNYQPYMKTLEIDKMFICWQNRRKQGTSFTSGNKIFHNHWLYGCLAFRLGAKPCSGFLSIHYNMGVVNI